MDFVTKLTFTVCLAGCIFVGAVQAEDFAINCTATEISVDENSPTNLTTITAKNATFSVTDETGVGHFFTIDKDGTLSTETLDVETLNGTQFNIIILANSSLNNLSNCTVQINITDVNDNAPKFTQKEYTANLQDHTRKGSSVINVTATDNDLTSPNNAVWYSLVGRNKDDFAIDEAGHIKVATSNVSSVAIPSYNLQVVATDKGDPPLRGTANLTICVGNCGGNGSGRNSADILVTWTVITLVGSYTYVIFLQEM